MAQREEIQTTIVNPIPDPIPEDEGYRALKKIHHCISVSFVDTGAAAAAAAAAAPPPQDSIRGVNTQEGSARQNMSTASPVANLEPRSMVEAAKIVSMPQFKTQSSELRYPHTTETRGGTRKSRLVLKDNILKSLASDYLTEKEIFRDVGDSRYTREVVRTLLAEAKIYRVGKGGQCDPFRYVAAEFYDGADKLPEGIVKDLGLERRLLRVATGIKDLVCEARDGLTEKEIRSVVGDSASTGKALRNLISLGHVKRMGRGGNADPYVYEVVSGFESVAVDTSVRTEMCVRTGLSPRTGFLAARLKDNLALLHSTVLSHKAIEPEAPSSSGPRDISPSRGTVVSAPSSPPALTSSNRAPPSLAFLSKLNLNTKPSFEGFAANSVVWGIPVAESGAKSSAITHESSGYCPSAFDDGSLVCTRCHEIVMPHDIPSHDSTCEANQNSPLFDARVSPLTRSDKGVASSGANVQGGKHGYKAAAGSLGSRAHSLQSTGNFFSFSGIQSRFNSKIAALLQEPFDDKVTTSAPRHTYIKVIPRQLTRYTQAQSPACSENVPHKTTRSRDSATNRNKCSGKVGRNASAIGESCDSHAEEASGDGCAENDFPDHVEHHESLASSNSDSDMLLISPLRYENLASALSPQTRSSQSLISDSSNAASRKSVVNVRHRLHDDGPNPLKLRRIQNGTNMPLLKSETAANSSPCLLTRSATHTDRARCPDPADSSSSYCQECGLGGGFLLGCCKPNCSVRSHPMCCGHDPEVHQRRFECPRCRNPRLKMKSNLRFIACIVAAFPGDVESFGIWLGYQKDDCVVAFPSQHNRIVEEVVNYSDPTQSKPPLVHPADLKFYTLSTLRQHVKQFEVLRAFLNGSIDHKDMLEKMASCSSKPICKWLREKCRSVDSRSGTFFKNLKKQFSKVIEEGSPTVGFSKELCGMLRCKTEGD